MRKSIERVQTGVRLEKRLLKALKGLAGHLDASDSHNLQETGGVQ